MNIIELELLKRVQQDVYSIIKHKKPCQGGHHDPVMATCDNLAECYVVLASEEEGCAGVLEPRCAMHAVGHQRVHLTEWQERVLEERDELHGKIVKLMNFESSAFAAKLPTEERCALVNQLEFMRDYLSVLTERIKRFTGGFDIELPSE